MCGQQVLKYIPCMGVHWLNALPVIFPGQLHMGTWPITVHKALIAQAPGQGSTHLLRTQALSRGQSVFRTHSGRQPTKGSPRNSGRQVQIPSEHSALGPQGDGTQASSTGDGIAVKYNRCTHTEMLTGSEWWLEASRSKTQGRFGECLRVAGNNSQRVNVLPV